MAKRVLLLSSTALIVLSLLTACGKYDAQQKEAIGKAVGALRKVDASAQSGAKLQEYNQTLGEAKTQVADAVAALPPDDKELRDALNGALEAYTDAASVWSRKAEEGHKAILASDEPGRTVIPKYELPTETVDVGAALEKYGAKKGELKYTVSKLDEAVQKIWSVGRARLNRAASLGTGKEAVGASPTPPPPHVDDSVLTIQAAIVYNMGGAQPVARNTFYLLDESVGSILRKAGLKPESNITLLDTYGFALKYPDQHPGFAARAAAAMRPHIIKIVTTDFEGKAQFEPVPPGSYYVHAMTETRGGMAIWDKAVTLKPGENKLLLDQNNADTAF